MPIDPTDQPVARLLRAQQTSVPDALGDTLARACAAIGGRDVVLYLVDYAYSALMPHPDVLPHGRVPQISTLDGSVAGRAFTSATPVATEHDDGWHVWIPVTEQANRLGVLALILPTWDADLERTCVELGLAAAHLVIDSAQYTDLPHLLRRRENMTLAAEMQWSLLPPLSFAAAGVAIAGLLEPAYEVGGDCFDYAFNDGVLEFAIVDTMGHGLYSAVIASLLVGAYRHGRRARLGLDELAIAIDAAIRVLPGQPAFGTAILGQLDSATGRLRWVNCGHPRPIVLRDGSALDDVAGRVSVPLGLSTLGAIGSHIFELDLQPGDGVLLYTDGVTESRTADGEFFGEERLRDLAARESTAADSAQEVTRRLARTVLEYAGRDLRDDATLLYIQWTPDGAQTGSV
jgi:serine phosphatase RsbU (regulator of sigma subunit)